MAADDFQPLRPGPSADRACPVLLGGEFLGQLLGYLTSAIPLLLQSAMCRGRFDSPRSSPNLISASDSKATMTENDAVMAIVRCSRVVPPQIVIGSKCCSPSLRPTSEAYLAVGPHPLIDTLQIGSPEPQQTIVKHCIRGSREPYQSPFHTLYPSPFLRTNKSPRTPWPEAVFDKYATLPPESPCVLKEPSQSRVLCSRPDSPLVSNREAPHSGPTSIPRDVGRRLEHPDTLANAYRSASFLAYLHR